MTLDEMKENNLMSMDDIKLFIQQTACVIDETWENYPSDYEKWLDLAKKNYPMADPDDSWKGWYIDISNALEEINHPQSHELRNLFIRPIFCSACRTGVSHERLCNILKLLKKNPVSIISDIEFNKEGN